MSIENGSNHNNEVNNNNEINNKNSETESAKKAEHIQNGKSLDSKNKIEGENKLKSVEGKALTQETEKQKSARLLDENNKITADKKDTPSVDNTPEKKEKESSENKNESRESDEREKEKIEGLNPENEAKIKEINNGYYEKASEVAKNSPENGRFFTDHKEDHVEMVKEKSSETADALKKGVENGTLPTESDEKRVGFSSDIDKKTLEGAALAHDTGMSGDGYALVPEIDENGKVIKDENNKTVYKKDENGDYLVQKEDNNNFDDVRNNHSLNSALNMLEHRDEYKDAGYTDEDIDKMAVECMAHSKSSSGVMDLNSKEDWSDCFDRMDAAIDAYNKDHPDSTISFDRSTFENDDKKLSSLATETLALRVGDVSRDSGPDAEAQSGEKVHVDRTTLDNNAKTIDGEMKNADITIGENNEIVTNQKSRQVHAGEQNITENHTYCSDDGSICHEVTIDDINSAPNCTAKALEDHVGEFGTAKDGHFDIKIKTDDEPSKEAKEVYESFRLEMMKKSPNVDIYFPWDEE